MHLLNHLPISVVKVIRIKQFDDPDDGRGNDPLSCLSQGIGMKWAVKQRIGVCFTLICVFELGSAQREIIVYLQISVWT